MTLKYTTLLFTLISLAYSNQAHAAPNIVLCWEAENAHQIKKPLRRSTATEKKSVSDSTQYPSRGYLQMPWVANAQDGSASYRFEIKTPGIYYVWARIKYINTFSNSLRVSINRSRSGNSRYGLIGEQATWNQWTWHNSRTRFHCDKGLNALTLTDMEMGIRVDQILLTSNPNFTPAGIQKVTR